MPPAQSSTIDTIVSLGKTCFFPFLFGTLVLNLLWNRFRPGLSKIPGPTLAKYTKIWRLYDVFKGQAHKTAIRLHREHGPLVRIAPNVVSVGDPKALPIIYGLKTNFTKVVENEQTSGPYTNLLIDRVLSPPKHLMAEEAADEPLLDTRP